MDMFGFKKDKNIKNGNLWDSYYKDEWKNIDFFKGTLYEKIKDLTPKTIKRLHDFNIKKHHSNDNYVLLPKTGALNNVKGNIYYHEDKKSFKIYNNVGRPPQCRYDRPDTFIYFLSKFWEIKNNKN